MLWFPIMLHLSLSFDLIALPVHLSLGLGLGAWVGGRGGSELGRRAGSVAACVGGVGQGGGGVRGLKVERERELRVVRVLRRKKKSELERVLRDESFK